MTGHLARPGRPVASGADQRKGPSRPGTYCAPHEVYTPSSWSRPLLHRAETTPRPSPVGCSRAWQGIMTWNSPGPRESLEVRIRPRPRAPGAWVRLRRVRAGTRPSRAAFEAQSGSPFARKVLFWPERERPGRGRPLTPPPAAHLRLGSQTGVLSIPMALSKCRFGAKIPDPSSRGGPQERAP